MYSFTDYAPYYKRNLKIAVPIMFSQLGQALVSIVDSLMVAQLGTNQLAAISFANSFSALLYVFLTGITLGATPLIGESFANNKKEQVTTLFKNSITLNVIIAVVLIMIFLGGSFFMNRMGQTPEVSQLALNYTRIILVSLLPYILFCSFKQLMEGVCNTKIAMVVTIACNLLNVVLNYIFIYGKLGMPAMGIDGAGIATLISRIAMPIMFGIMIWKKPLLKIYLQGFALAKIEWKRIKSLIAMGFPIAMQMLVEVSAFALSAIMMGWMGAVPLAAHQIANSMSHLTFMTVMGIASASTIRVSFQYGAGEWKSLRKAGFASLHLGVIFNFCTALSLILLREPLASLFTSDPEVLRMACSLLILAGIFQLSDGLQVIALGGLRGLHDVKRPMYYAILTYLIINLPMGYLLAFKGGFGPEGIWYAFIVSLGIAAVLYITRFNRYSRQLIIKHGNGK